MILLKSDKKLFDYFVISDVFFLIMGSDTVLCSY